MTMTPVSRLSTLYGAGHRRLVPVLMGLMLVVPGTATGCPIPVFQYALEHWQADPYLIEVSHSGELSEDQQAALQMLEKAATAGTQPANLVLEQRQVQVTGEASERLPLMEVRYPSLSGIRRTVWSGPLNLDNAAQLLDSPIRQEIASHLIDRRSAVWVLLESGDRRKDRRAVEVLERELPRLENTLRVPDPGEEWGMDAGEIITDVTFHWLRLRRDDPAEQMLIRMLLETEGDLHDYAEEPMVFPVYGRGLVMYALIGEGINGWTLREAGEFVVGPCSCQIKASNPGVDLLVSRDWNAEIVALSRYEPPAPAGTAGFLDRMDTAGERLRD